MATQDYFLRTTEALEAMNENLDNNIKYYNDSIKEGAEKLGYDSRQIGDSLFYATPYNEREALMNAGDYASEYLYDAVETGGNAISAAFKTGSQYTVDTMNVGVTAVDETTGFSLAASAAAHFGLRLVEEGYERAKDYWHQFCLDVFGGVTYQDKDGVQYLGLDAIERMDEVFSDINDTLDDNSTYYDEETGEADDFSYSHNATFIGDFENNAFKWHVQILYSCDGLMKLGHVVNSSGQAPDLWCVVCGEPSHSYTINVNGSASRYQKSTGSTEVYSYTTTIQLSTYSEQQGSFVYINGQRLCISNQAKLSVSSISSQLGGVNIYNCTEWSWTPYPVKAVVIGQEKWINSHNLVPRPNEYGISGRIPGCSYPMHRGVSVDYPTWYNSKLKRNIDDNGNVDEDLDNPYIIPFTTLPDDVIPTIPSTDIDKLYDPHTYYPTPQDMSDVINHVVYHHIYDYNDDVIKDNFVPDGFNPLKPSGKGVNTGTTVLPDLVIPAEAADDTGFVAVYHPSKSIVKAFNQWLWSIGFDLDTFKKLFQDPMSAIISLHQIYYTPSDAENPTTIRLGYIDTSISCPYTDDTNYTLDCGTMFIPDYYENALDYDPYTVYSLYLPFIGFKQIAARDIAGQNVHIYYNIDIITGACVAFIEVDRGNFRATMYSFAGNCAVEIPITSSNFSSVISSIVGAVVGIGATIAVGAATGGAAAPIAAGAATTAVGAATHANIAIERSGNLGGNIGALAFKKPYIIVTRPVSKVAYDYNKYMGYPASSLVKLSRCSGFTRVRDVIIDDVEATSLEKDTIRSLLTSGIIL